MKISGVHASVQWFVVLLVITAGALLVGAIAEKLGAQNLAHNVTVGVIVLWIILSVGALMGMGGYFATALIKTGAEIGANRDKINVEREAIAAHAAQQLTKGFQLGYQMTRSLPDAPMLPMGDDNLLPALETWRAPLMIESGEEQ